MSRRLVLPMLAISLVFTACGASDDSSSAGPVGVNLARGGTVAASEPGPGGGVRVVVDGDLNTGWSGPAAPYWFEIDLGEQTPIKHVRLLSGRDVDAHITVNVGVHDNPGRQPGSFDGPVVSGVWLEVNVGYEARFVRVTVAAADGPTTWMELEVFS